MNIANESALFRTWRPACVGAWSFFLIFQVLIGYDKYKSVQPLCPYSDFEYPRWYWYICYGVLGAFIIIWFVVLSKISQIENLEDKVPHLVAFNIVSMGTLATILALVLNWGGVCIDVLGVASPASIWGEWFACGPLLIYVVISLDSKPTFNRMDWFLMGTFFLCLITGFFIIIPSSVAVGIFWLVLSCVTYLPSLYLPCYCSNTSAVQLATADGELIELGMPHIFARKQKLAWVLTLIFPFFTVNYLIAYAGWITPAQTIAIYQILSVATKGFFTAVAMDVHFDLLESARRALTEESSRRAIAEENFRSINEARRNFLKYIFHELRSPLNSLTIGIEVLEKSEGITEVDIESLGLMKVASTFMNDTLNNVLNIQKIEEGKLELDMEPFSISDAVFKVKAALRGELLQKRIQLVLYKSPLVPDQIMGDRYRIEHVIMNFVSNAIKFSPEESSIAVDVSVERNAADAPSDSVTVLLAVKDEGPGISVEDQEKLFKNFVQIRPGKLQKGGGSGLGLTIAKQIVELHGGRIGVTSVEGQGSQFYFAIPFQVYSVVNTNILDHASSVEVSLPLLDVHRPPPVSLQESKATELDKVLERVVSPKPQFKRGDSSPIPRRADLRVLSVDDSESSLKMMKMLLKKLDVIADTAENGRIAVDMILGAADTEPYHLVLMDNLMPEMNGVEAVRLLRQQGCEVLIIGVTGNVLEDDIAEYLSAGANMVLAKPLKILALQRILEFISEGEMVVSRPDYVLVEQNNKIQWAPIKKGVKN